MANDAQIDPSLLPETLREIAEVVGLPAAVRLVEWRGGVRVYVPARVTERHPLARVLGVRAAAALCARYPGAELCIPRAEAALRAVRDADIRRRYSGGEGAPALALEYGLSLRQIRSIVAGQPDHRQITLL
jgi:Mor family transcriptional regulator